MFVGPKGPLGGALQKRAGTPQWLPYVGVTDVDAAAATVTRLGGRTQTPPADLPNGGRHAVLVDPQGAPFGIHASKATPAPESAAAVGEFSWHELATNGTPETAFAFYTAVFGWDEINRFDMGPMGTYLIFGRNGGQLGGMFDKGTAGKPGAAYWLGYVRVNDLDAAIERARACVEAGADMIFPEAITELSMYKKFADAVKVPILANITEFGQTPLFTVQELASANVAMVLYPLSAFRAMNAAALRVYQGIRKDGSQKGVVELMQSRDELYDFLGYNAYESKLDALFAREKKKK